MQDKFAITHDIEKIDCSIAFDTSYAASVSFVENVIIGTAKLKFLDKELSVARYPLFVLSRSLIRLCTFPILYGCEASESVLEQDIDFRSNFSNGRISLHVNDGRKGEFESQVFLDDALRTVGTFHLGLLAILLQECPAYRGYHIPMERIPDAFALAGILANGRRA
jgi:hypothetical protein